MAETIILKTDQFSNSSFNTSKSELKRAVDALNSLDYYGALWNATYTCNGVSQRIFTAAMIEEATALAIQVEKLRGKLEAYSKLLQSGPEALQDVDASFKGEYTNAWQRTWYSISSGVSSVYETIVGFWESLFRKGGKKTGSKTKINTAEDRRSNTSVNNAKENDSPAQEPISKPTSPYLESKEFNGVTYNCLNVKDKYPGQAAGQCWANCVSISNSIMKDEGVSGSRHNASIDYKEMAKDISDGKPVLLHFLHDGNGGEHWIVAVGVKAGSSEPYSINDFLFVDSWDGNLCTWDRFLEWKDSYPNPRPCGLQRH